MKPPSDHHGHAELAAPSADNSASRDLEKRFQELVKHWKKDTAHLGVIGRMVKHAAYQEIIRMGRPAVPLLLAELNSRPDFWFDALEAITGQDPVPPQSAGKVREMARAWVEWGRAEGLLP